jgi:hypothetical protein
LTFLPTHSFHDARTNAAARHLSVDVSGGLWAFLLLALGWRVGRLMEQGTTLSGPIPLFGLGDDLC